MSALEGISGFGLKITDRQTYQRKIRPEISHEVLGHQRPRLLERLRSFEKIQEVPEHPFRILEVSHHALEPGVLPAATSSTSAEEGFAVPVSGGPTRLGG